MKREVPSRIVEDQQSRREKENKRKVKKLKEKRFTTEPGILASRKTHLKKDISWRDVWCNQNDQQFYKHRNHQCWVNWEIGQASSSRPFLLWLLEKGVLNKNITRTLQAVVAGLNEESTEDSSLKEDSTDKLDEEDIQELAEKKIQESVAKMLPKKRLGVGTK